MKFLLNDKEINPPNEFQEEIEVEISFEKQNEIHNQEYMLYNHHLNLGRWLN